MAYTLVYLTSAVPVIPDPAGKPGQIEKAGLAHPPRPPDRREHFGTEEAALRRARAMLPFADWLDLRLYGPDGRLLAGQAALAAQLVPAPDNSRQGEAFVPSDKEENTR